MMISQGHYGSLRSTKDLLYFIRETIFEISRITYIPITETKTIAYMFLTSKALTLAGPLL